MSRIEDIISGLKIIKEYPTYDVCFEHDVIYISAFTKEIDYEDIEILKYHGWIEDEDGWKHY